MPNQPYTSELYELFRSSTRFERTMSRPKGHFIFNSPFGLYVSPPV